MPPPLPQATCTRCGKSIDADDIYCRNCGRRQGAGGTWYYSTAGIVFLALFAIGPFALILIWKSTRMGAVAKKVLTGFIVVYTALTIYYSYQIIILVLAEMTELSEVMSGIR